MSGEAGAKGVGDVEIFFCDLDNTLIYSHRKKPKGDLVLAETLNGREQSYMTRYALSYLSSQSRFSVVPVTTRSESQYRRLEGLLSAIGCRACLLCNGALLAVNGELDRAWRDGSAALAGPALKALSEAERWLKGNCGEELTHSAQGMFVYAKTAEPQIAAAGLEKNIDGALLEVRYDGRKVYCLPRVFNKGLAVKRFIERFPADRTIGAGDSDFDIPMLEEVDVALAPETIFPLLRNSGRIALDTSQTPLSDAICTALQTIV